MDHIFDFDNDGDFDTDDLVLATDAAGSESEDRIRRLVEWGYLHPDAAENLLRQRQGYGSQSGPSYAAGPAKSTASVQEHSQPRPRYSTGPSRAAPRVAGYNHSRPTQQPTPSLAARIARIIVIALLGVWLLWAVFLCAMTTNGLSSGPSFGGAVGATDPLAFFRFSAVVLVLGLGYYAATRRTDTTEPRQPAPPLRSSEIRSRNTQCLGKTAEGTRCQRTVPRGQNYCHQHLSQDPARGKSQDKRSPEIRRCQGTTLKGTPCRRRVAPGKQYCSLHAVPDGRCKAKTTAGKRCKRGAAPGELYCYQHAAARQQPKQGLAPSAIYGQQPPVWPLPRTRWHNYDEPSDDLEPDTDYYHFPEDVEPDPDFDYDPIPDYDNQGRPYGHPQYGDDW